MSTCIVLSLILSTVLPAWPDEDPVKAEQRERCVQILRTALKGDAGFWMSVHAAENLLFNVYTEGVEDHFRKLDSSDRRSIIGISRVLARANKKYAIEFEKHVNRIRDEFLDEDSPNRAGALESLGKLKYKEHLPEIVHVAKEGGSDIRGMARWVLANSGNAEDEAYLAELLSSEEPLDYFYAAYALRFFDKIRPRTAELLEACYLRLAPDAPHRAYVVSSWYIHASTEKKESVNKELLVYALGEKRERYEMCEALSITGNNSDIPLLEKLLDDPEMDVRVSAANAILRIERREFRGLRWLDWTVIFTFALSMLGIGWYFSKRQKTSEEYLVGSRNVNSFISGISLFASFLSTISYLAIVGEVIKHGPLVMVIHIVSFPVVYFITAYLFIPFFMKLPITSAYEIIGKPLGNKVRLTGSIIFLLTRFMWMALLIYLTSKALV